MGSIDEIIEVLRIRQEYTPGISLSKASSLIGLPKERMVKLNANENLFVPPEFMRIIARRAADEVDHRLYPGDLVDEVYDKLSRYLRVGREHLLLGCGADQLLDLLIALLGRKGVVSVHPTFMYYRERCKLYGAPYRYVWYNRDLSIDTNKLKPLLSKSSLLILCSPNNPTGHTVPVDVIEELANVFNGIIVLDEIYAEFSNTKLHKLPLDLENVIVVRSFSKAFAAASIRLGYIVGSEKLIDILRLYQQPYPVTGFSLKFASILLDYIDYFKKVWNEVREVREWFYKELSRYNELHVYSSQANFISFGCDIGAEDLHTKLMRKGFLIRVFDNLLGFRCLARVTLTHKNVLEKFIIALGEVIKE